MNLILSCEHASRILPKTNRPLIPTSVLKSHWGWDWGALQLAKSLAQSLKAPLIAGQFSRLLVDLNRSPNNPAVFSSWSKQWGKEKLLQQYHKPHWEKVQAILQKKIKSKQQVLHLGIHSFTPSLNGHERPTEIGLLYDPRRIQEQNICTALQKQMSLSSSFKIHKNLPYRGSTDGLITEMRKVFSEKNYLGIEIEINQRLLKNTRTKELVIGVLSEGLLSLSI